MKQSTIKLSKLEIKFLKSLLEDGSKHDVQIAKETNMSKASAHRIRKKLQEEEVLVDFLPIVDLEKFGIEFYTILIYQWLDFNEESTSKMVKEITDDPHSVYFATGESSDGMTHVVMLGFIDLSEYHAYVDNFRKKYKQKIGKFFSFFIPSKNIVKQDYSGLVGLSLGGEQK